MLKKVLGVLAVVLLGFLAFVATRPDHYHVERSASINAPAAIIYAQLDDLKKWADWSPWDKIDPNVKKTFEGPDRGVGQSYTWQGNSDVGTGQMTIASAEPQKRVTYKLDFREPMAAQAEATIIIAKEGASAHKVTWGMDGANNFMGKLFGVFMDMDKMIGKDFEKGLSQLKGIAEEEAKKQRVVEQAPTAAAPAEEPEQPEGAGH